MTPDVQQDAVVLAGLPASADDIDVSAADQWIAVCRTATQLLVCSAAGQFAAPEEIRFPLVRWLTEDRVVVLDTRTTKGRDNAYVFTVSGESVAQFCAGDADVSGARGAGMRSIWRRDPAVSRTVEADAIIDHLGELLQVLSR